MQTFGFWRFLAPRFTVPLLIGFAPVATMLVSWTPEGQAATLSTMLIKAFAIPFLLAEIGVILIAVLHPKARQVQSNLGVTTLGCLIAFLALAFFNAFLVAANPLMAFLRTGTYLVHLLLGMAMFRLIRSAIVRTDDCLMGLFGGFAVAGLLLMFFIHGVENPVSFNWVNDLPGYDNIRRVGYYAGPVVMMCLARMAVSGHWLPRAACLIASFIGLTLILWSGTRGALYALAFTYLLLSALAPSLRKAQNWASGVSVVLLSSLAAWVMAAPSASLGAGRLAMTENFSSGRVVLWQETLLHILKRPFLGYGESQISYLSSNPGLSGLFHPHNLLLQAVLAWGLAGTAILAWLSWPVVKKLLQAPQQAVSLSYLAGALLLLVYSAIDGTLFHVTSAGLFAFCVGGALGALPSGRQKHDWSAGPARVTA